MKRSENKKRKKTRKEVILGSGELACFEIFNSSKGNGDKYSRLTYPSRGIEIVKAYHVPKDAQEDLKLMNSFVAHNLLPQSNEELLSRGGIRSRTGVTIIMHRN